MEGGRDPSHDAPTVGESDRILMNHQRVARVTGLGAATAQVSGGRKKRKEEMIKGKWSHPFGRPRPLSHPGEEAAERATGGEGGACLINARTDANGEAAFFFFTAI